MRWIYRIAAAAISLLGAAAIASDIPNLISGGHEFLSFPGLGALIGLAFLTIGALNLLNDRYEPDAPGLAPAAIIVDLLAAIIVARIVSLGGVNPYTYPVLAVLILLPILALVVSRQRRQRHGPDTRAS